MYRITHGSHFSLTFPWTFRAGGRGRREVSHLNGRSGSQIIIKRRERESGLTRKRKLSKNCWHSWYHKSTKSVLPACRIFNKRSVDILQKIKKNSVASLTSMQQKGVASLQNIHKTVLPASQKFSKTVLPGVAGRQGFLLLTSKAIDVRNYFINREIWVAGPDFKKFRNVTILIATKNVSPTKAP